MIHKMVYIRVSYFVNMNGYIYNLLILNFGLSMEKSWYPNTAQQWYEAPLSDRLIDLMVNTDWVSNPFLVSFLVKRSDIVKEELKFLIQDIGDGGRDKVWHFKVTVWPATTVVASEVKVTLRNGRSVNMYKLTINLWCLS